MSFVVYEDETREQAIERIRDLADHSHPNMEEFYTYSTRGLPDGHRPLLRRGGVLYSASRKHELYATTQAASELLASWNHAEGLCIEYGRIYFFSANKAIMTEEWGQMRLYIDDHSIQHEDDYNDEHYFQDADLEIEYRHGDAITRDRKMSSLRAVIDARWCSPKKVEEALARIDTLPVVPRPPPPVAYMTVHGSGFMLNGLEVRIRNRRLTFPRFEAQLTAPPQWNLRGTVLSVRTPAGWIAWSTSLNKLLDPSQAHKSPGTYHQHTRGLVRYTVYDSGLESY